jgi:hypothetical protein
MGYLLEQLKELIFFLLDKECFTLIHTLTKTKSTL